MTTWNSMVDAHLHDESKPELPPLRCALCGTDIYEGDDYIEYDGMPYCSAICLTDQLVLDGLARDRVHGEEDGA